MAALNQDPTLAQAPVAGQAGGSDSTTTGFLNGDGNTGISGYGFGNTSLTPGPITNGTGSFVNTSVVTPPAGPFYQPNTPATDPANAAALNAPANPATGLNLPGSSASTTSSSAAFDPNSWVTSALSTAKSTDDPGYWQAKISQDPNVQNPATRDSALAYWQGRINQGNGNGLGNPLFNDSPGGGSTAGGSSSSSSTGGSTQFMGLPQMNYQQTPQDSNLFNILMGKAQQSLNVDPNDPIIAGQVNAARASNERGTKDYLASVAEQAGPHANMDASTRSANEKSNQQTTALQSQLMQNELNARRTEIQNALSESGSMLTAEDQLALQRELGLLNAGINSTQVGNSFNLGQQQINSGNDQFNATYGLNATNQGNYWDAIRSGLIGG